LIIPTTDDALAGRARQTTEMIDPKLKPEEMKIRISGNITLLTNGGNRSYYFLDTFNKRGGKWQIIATHFSRVSDSKNENNIENNIENNNENVEQTIMRLERERSDAAFRKDDAAMRRILADDFIAVESSGRILSKAQIISETERSGDARSGATGDIKVKVYGETAVVTGRSLMKGENGEIDSDVKLLFTSIWAKRSGQWQAVNYQATRTK
jgi:hypothetical protein